ncbi:MAG: S9 family peptidase, partial [Gammaproteobacteria bacterium]
MKNLVLAVFCASLLWTGYSAAQPSGKLAYPPAARDKVMDSYFGTKVPAPYQWMENLDNPALHKWVAEENDLTDAYLAKIPVR